jgi:predicted nucleic acid-binding protein
VRNPLVRGILCHLFGPPEKPTLAPEHVFLFIQEIRQRLSPVVLDTQEYLDTVESTSACGLPSGKIYDALVLACAAKSEAPIIYTWNLEHFHSIALHLADRIQHP